MTPVPLQILATMNKEIDPESIPVSITFELDPTPGAYADLNIEPGSLLTLRSTTGMTVRVNGHTITYAEFQFSIVKDNGCDVVSINGIAPAENLAIFNTSNCLTEGHELPYTYSLDAFLNSDLWAFTGTPLDTILRDESQQLNGIVDAIYRLDQIGTLVSAPLPAEEPPAPPPQDPPPAPEPDPVPVPPTVVTPPAPTTGVVVEAPAVQSGGGLFSGADVLLLSTLLIAGGVAIMFRGKGGH